MQWQRLEVSDQVPTADWIRDSLHPFAQDVGAVVPPVFPAYARIFHPAHYFGRNDPEVRWSEVAALTGKTVHPEMQFHAIAPTGNQVPRVYEPRPGALSKGQVAALVPLLQKFTATPGSCWFCLWEGYGYLHPGGVAPLIAARPPLARARIGLKRLQLRWSAPRPPGKDGPRVRLPHRDYLLFHAPLAEALGWEDGPNLWWPDDRAWCVASEIDLPYTYVGGPQALIEAIVSDPAIESLPAKAADGITYDSDRINSHT